MGYDAKQGSIFSCRNSFGFGHFEVWKRDRREGGGDGKRKNPYRSMGTHTGKGVIFSEKAYLALKPRYMLRLSFDALKDNCLYILQKSPTRQSRELSQNQQKRILA